MVNTFFISDSHFGHSNIITFKNEDGSLLRPFSSIEEKVYHLGDVVINRRCLPILSRLNGHKRLVRGNHDLFTTKDFMIYFEEIYGVRVIGDLIFSHIPIHEDQLSRWKSNVHGHLHGNRVMKDNVIDERYISVCCE